MGQTPLICTATSPWRLQTLGAFIAYSDLNESTVISWLEAAIDASAGDENPTVAQMRAGLAGILAAKGAELLPTPKPW
jgi:hypothetical protein